MPPPTSQKTSLQSSSNTNASQAALIFDIGQFETKFGLQTEKNPTIIPTVVSFELPVPKNKKPEFTVGKDAVKKAKLANQKKQNAQSSSVRGNRRNVKEQQQRTKKPTSSEPSTVLRYPYQSGAIVDWDQYEAIIQFAYDQNSEKFGANYQPERNPVIVTADPLSSMIHRQGTCELFVEYFNCERFYMEAPGVLAMRNQSPSGVLNGLAVSSGASFSSITPVLNNKPLYTSTVHFPVAGQVLSSYILEMVKTAGFELAASDAHRVAQHVKKNMAYTAMDLNEELKGLAQSPEEFVQELELPSGESLEIGGEAFKVVESMFNPQVLGIFDDSSIQKSIFDAVQKVKPEDRSALYSNIVLSGGNTLFHNFSARLQQEVSNYVRHTCDDKLAKSVNVNHAYLDQEEQGTTSSVWLGGKAWASEEAAGNTKIDWITRQEYQEEGSGRICLKKCF